MDISYSVYTAVENNKRPLHLVLSFFPFFYPSVPDIKNCTSQLFLKGKKRCSGLLFFFRAVHLQYMSTQNLALRDGDVIKRAMTCHNKQTCICLCDIILSLTVSDFSIRCSILRGFFFLLKSLLSEYFF